MANASEQRFARLPAEGIYQIGFRESKLLQIVQDKLGYALGRASGSACLDARDRSDPLKELAST